MRVLMQQGEHQAEEALIGDVGAVEVDKGVLQLTETSTLAIVVINYT